MSQDEAYPVEGVSKGACPLEGACALPRDVLVEIAKRAGLDGLRALGVRPGRLRVPPALAAALGASLSVRRELQDGNNDWMLSSVCLRIPDTDRAYMLSRRKTDLDRGIELTVELHAFCSHNGVFFPLDRYLFYRGDRPRLELWTMLIDLDAFNGPGSASCMPRQANMR